MQRRLEGALRLPRYLLAYVAERDRDRISRLTDLDPDLRRYLLDMLAEQEQAVPVPASRPRRRAG